MPATPALSPKQGSSLGWIVALGIALFVAAPIVLYVFRESIAAMAYEPSWQAMANGAIEHSKTRFVSRDAIMLGPYYGLELVSEDNPKEKGLLMVTRIYWMPPRTAYMTIIGGKDAGPIHADRTKFFDSFRITPRASPAARRQRPPMGDCWRATRSLAAVAPEPAEPSEHGAKPIEKPEELLALCRRRKPENHRCLDRRRRLTRLRARTTKASGAISTRASRRLAELQIGTEQRPAKLITEHRMTARPLPHERVAERQRVTSDNEAIERVMSETILHEDNLLKPTPTQGAPWAIAFERLCAGGVTTRVL